MDKIIASGTIGIITGSILDILEVPGGGLLIGFGLSSLIFVLTLRQVCSKCKPSTSEEKR